MAGRLNTVVVRDSQRAKAALYLAMTTGAPSSVDTTVGNYFVSNYPPFSTWSPQRVGELHDKLEQRLAPDTPLGMYVHIPFCRKRCHFCYFKVYTGKNSSDLRAYVDALIDEAAMWARHEYVAGRPLKFVYFGGGTPSYLSDTQLGHLVEGLQRACSWDGAEEVALECEPGTLTRKKLAAMRDMGVTRLSLGIENFADEVLELNNRAHDSQAAQRAYDEARAVGFGQINIDLIAGMLGETDRNWERCIEQTLAWQPDAVTIYQMEIPHNTGIYKQMRESGQEVAPVADWETKRRWVREAFAALEVDGYTITSAYTAVKDGETARFVYRDALWGGADMLGVGVSSFGHLGGVHYQNQHDIVPYLSTVAGGELPVYRALAMTAEEQMIRQFVLQLKRGRLVGQTFREKFGVDVLARWGDTLKRYQDKGYMTVDGDVVQLTRAGLLEVDRLLHAFFLPEHSEVRYA